MPLIQDDQLRLDVQGFIGQEAVHSRAHAKVLAHFAARGVDLTPYTGQVRWLFEKLLGPRPGWSLRRQHSWVLEQVSLVSAIEHYTAVLGEWVLNVDLGTAPAVRRRLPAVGPHPPRRGSGCPAADVVGVYRLLPVPGVAGIGVSLAAWRESR